MSINIGKQNKSDPSFRYRMDDIVVKDEGRGNGVKTLIVNIEKVALQLHTDTDFLTKYFSFRMATRTSFTQNIGCVIYGRHTKPSLMAILEDFVEEVIVCPKCHIPCETTFSSSKTHVQRDCRACGYHGNMKEDKIVEYMHKKMRKSAPKKKGGAEKKHDEEADKAAEAPEDDESTSGKAAKAKKKGGSPKKEKPAEDAAADEEAASEEVKPKKKKKDKKAEGVESSEDTAAAATEETSEEVKPKKKKKDKKAAEEVSEDAAATEASEVSEEAKPKKKKKDKTAEVAPEEAADTPATDKPKKKKKDKKAEDGAAEEPEASEESKEDKPKKKKKDKKAATEEAEEAPETPTEETKKPKKKAAGSAASGEKKKKDADKKDNGISGDTSEEAQEARLAAEMAEMKMSGRKAATTGARVDDPVELLSIFITSQPREPAEVLSEVKRLSLTRDWDHKQRIQALYGAVLKNATSATLVTILESSSKLLRAFGRDSTEQLNLLFGIELFVTETRNALAPKLAVALQALYVGDVVTEDAIMAWHTSPENTWLQSKNAATVAKGTRQKASKFIEALQSNADDGEEEEEE